MSVEWDFVWKREYSLFYGISALYGSQKVIKRLVGVTPAVRGEGCGGWFSAFNDADASKKFTAYLKDILLHHPDIIKKEIASMHRVGRAFVAFTKKLSHPAKIPTEKLIVLHKEFYEFYMDYCDNLWFTFCLVEECSRLFESFVQTLPVDKQADAVAYYAAPSKKTGVLLIADYFTKEPDRNKRIAFIAKKYPWLGNIDVFVPRMTPKQIENYVDTFKAPAAHIPQQPSLSLTKEQKKFIKQYQELLFVKDRRDEYRREAFYLSVPFVQEFARRLNSTVTELGLLTANELEQAFQEPAVWKQEIERRKQGYLIEIIHGVEKIRSGAGVIKEFLNQNTVTATSVKGITGAPGIARGRVHLVRVREDLDVIREGDVLVAITTNVDYTTAMQKASAFVTDEGGIACHAAIVAREMKKPCVVGTKCATKIFKDGDLVEVDAHKGIVRKLKPKDI